MNDDTENQPQSNLDAEIREKAEKLHIDEIDWNRGITPGEILYLLNTCQFLQITNPAPPVFNQPAEAKIFRSSANWPIHVFENERGELDAMSSSPGDLLFRPEDNLGHGTWVRQAWVTATEMAIYAQQKGCPGIDITDGTPLMIRAFCNQARQVENFPVYGYEPTAEDQRVFALLNRDIQPLLKRRSASLSRS